MKILRLSNYNKNYNNFKKHKTFYKLKTIPYEYVYFILFFPQTGSLKKN